VASRRHRRHRRHLPACAPLPVSDAVFLLSNCYVVILFVFAVATIKYAHNEIRAIRNLRQTASLHDLLAVFNRLYSICIIYSDLVIKVNS
jgi:type III secretory pathway component EscU